MLKRLLRQMEALTASRPPDFIVGGSGQPYMLRWWVIPRNRLFSVYLHEFKRSDEDEALHDHPWFNLSLILRGRYWEHAIRAGGVERRVERTVGQLKFRSPWSAHRIEITEPGTLTLFITGPVMRTWGFHCARGWVRWRQFVDARDKGVAGRGCGE